MLRFAAELLSNTFVMTSVMLSKARNTFVRPSFRTTGTTWTVLVSELPKLSLVLVTPWLLMNIVKIRLCLLVRCRNRLKFGPTP